MNKALILKGVVLIICLLGVIQAIRFFSSSSFSRDLQLWFTDDRPKMKWCPDNVVDFKWLDESVPSYWKTVSPDRLKTAFCEAVIDPSFKAEVVKGSFRLLLMAQSAEAKKVVLQWVPETAYFKVLDISFKSEQLRQNLLAWKK